MNALDIVKAIALAFGILVVNVAISFAVVAAYSIFVNPGHDEAYYQAAAQWIAPWSSVAFGWLLFLIGCYVFSRRRPARNVYAFSIASFAAYAAIDLGLIAAADGLTSMMHILAISLGTKLLGALTGAWLAKR